jgi:hypothetical protein
MIKSTFLVPMPSLPNIKTTVRNTLTS